MAARELAESAAWAVREVLEAVGDEAKVGTNPWVSSRNPDLS